MDSSDAINPGAVPVSRITRLRLLTLNVHKGFSLWNRSFVLPELREAIRATAADLVFLQEVHGEHSGHALRLGRWPTVPQYEYLADSIWSTYAYGRNAVYPHGHHGNAILSKYPIIAHSNIDVSVGTQERRGILHCRLMLPGAGEMHAFCVHLGLRHGHRRQQLQCLSDYIEQHVPVASAVVAAGDFNDWRQHAGPILDRAGLQEVFVHLTGHNARTFPVRFPRFRLDRIYVRGVEIEEAKVLTSAPWPQLSDHLPLHSSIRL